MSNEGERGGRARTFAAKLAVERTVLHKVNRFPDAPELLGLTRSAITDWARRCNQAGLSGFGEAQDALLSIARATGTITDQSAHVVKDQKPIDPVLLEALEASLNSVMLKT